MTFRQILSGHDSRCSISRSTALPPEIRSWVAFLPQDAGGSL